MTRGDNLNKLTVASMQSLIDGGLRTVIDLRFTRELEEMPNPFAASGRSVPNVAYHHIPLFESADISSNETLTAGPRASAWNIALMEDWGHNVARTMKAIANAPEGVVLFHCHAGKDRTGLIGLLTLASVGVDEATLLDDYLQSNENLEPLFDEIRIKWGGTPEKRAEIEERLYGQPEMITGTLAHVRARYTDARGYLRHIGLSDGEINAIGGRLLSA